jgi:predicted esterase
MRLLTILPASAVIIAGAIAIAWHRGPSTTAEPPTVPSSQSASSSDAGIVPWCAEGLEPIAGGGCFAPATAAGSEPMVLVYLHGMYAPASGDDELDRQARVARAATAKGFSVVALRGKQGQCAREEVQDYWCWPSNERSADAGPAYVDAWAAALAVADARAGRGKRYLLGFSNGGYFAALIATRALMPFDAIAIAHAGPVEPVAPLGPRMPLLLVTADGDPSVLSMMLLDRELTDVSWPHAIVTRDGGHALTDGDIAFALTFFLRTQHEPLPLAPPLSLRVPVPDIVDASLPPDLETPEQDASVAEPTTDAPD